MEYHRVVMEIYHQKPKKNECLYKNVMAIHPVVVEIVQSGPKWWTNQ